MTKNISPTQSNPPHELPMPKMDLQWGQTHFQSKPRKHAIEFSPIPILRTKPKTPELQAHTQSDELPQRRQYARRASECNPPVETSKPREGDEQNPGKGRRVFWDRASLLVLALC
ncbi:hypothetical protein KC19_VG169000 [Ceratodon purpureus]|uniref:Uncharacterized protein n=1 Tax=Ceratodon purpureus TaxID=3225 RepID=A0A8T0HRY8_CERPU|nr:hypothetical protein KC19_VG169000 [Ceratodon purpureus]